MLHPDPAIPFVPASREQVVAIIESLNQPQLSIPGKPPQAAQAHLCGLRNANGSFSLFVSLHLAESGENVIYVPDRREVTVEEYRQAEAEALHFLESMGFMLDNLHYRNMAPALKDETLRRVPMFSPPRRPAPASQRRDRSRESLALLLASF